MQNCPSRETLSDFTDGALPPFQRWRVQRHARGCTACAQAAARERQWNAAARGYLASAVAPPYLRDTVLAALAIQPSAAPPVDARRKRRGAATLATALSLAGLALVAATLRPTPHGLPGLPPAYGEVAKSMEQIRTAQWTVTVTRFDTRTGKTTKSVERNSARMTPPALCSEYEGQVHLLTPQNLGFWERHGYRFRGDASSSKPFSDDEVLRHYISTHMVPPVASGSVGRGNLQSVQQSGKTLWRYELDTGSVRRLVTAKTTAEEGFGFDRPHLTRNGSRLTIWAEPDMRRVVRFESESYDGQTHNLIVFDHYVYDQPLPDALFRSPQSPQPPSVRK